MNCSFVESTVISRSLLNNELFVWRRFVRSRLRCHVNQTTWYTPSVKRLSCYEAQVIRSNMVYESVSHDEPSNMWIGPRPVRHVTALIISSSSSSSASCPQDCSRRLTLWQRSLIGHNQKRSHWIKNRHREVGLWRGEIETPKGVEEGGEWRIGFPITTNLGIWGSVVSSPSLK